MAALALTSAAVGLSAAGAATSFFAASGQTEAMQAQIAAEQRAEKLRKRQMELEARRRMLEITRNQQRARAMALTAATAQNASGGSGLQGGYGQISGDSGTQFVNTNQNLLIGRGLFAANSQISDARMQYASYGTQAAVGRGLSQLGSSLFSVTPQLTALSKGFGSAASASGGHTPGPVAYGNSAFGNYGIY